MMQAWMRIVACGTALAVRAKKPLDELTTDDVDALTYSTVQLGQSISGADYLESINQIHHFGRIMATLFQDFDVLVTPTLAEPPAKIGRFNPPTPISPISASAKSAPSAIPPTPPSSTLRTTRHLPTATLER